MPKGFFSQCFCLLTNSTITIDDLRQHLSPYSFELVGERDTFPNWQLSGPSLLYQYRPEVNGSVSLDVVDQPWPDSMGDPKADPMTFAAWSMGHFGPFNFPGSLSRACQHCWVQPEAKHLAESHNGFIRLRISYVVGADDSALVLPTDYDPLAELMFLSDLAMTLMEMPSVLGYFNPNGEVLRTYHGFVSEWNHFQQHDTVPLPLWTNVRFFTLTDQILLMDTVGNRQLDVDDLQAIAPGASFKPSQIDAYLRNVASYLLESKPNLKTCEAIDGPNETNLTWRIDNMEEAGTAPPRAVIRLTPKAHQKAIKAALASVGL